VLARVFLVVGLKIFSLAAEKINADKPDKYRTGGRGLRK